MVIEAGFLSWSLIHLSGNDNTESPRLITQISHLFGLCCRRALTVGIKEETLWGCLGEIQAVPKVSVAPLRESCKNFQVQCTSP